MSAPKMDVLRDVEDSIRFKCKCHGQNLCQHCHWANDIAAVRTVVAELINADKAYDRAQFLHAGRVKKIAASQRRQAALDRIGGAA